MYRKTFEYTDLSAYGPYNAFTADNAAWVYGNPYGFVPGELYRNMAAKSGWSKFSSTDPDSLFVDLHSAMTYAHLFDLAASDTLVVYIALITQQNGSSSDFLDAGEAARAWWLHHIKGKTNCCTLVGDVNCDGVINVKDVVSFIDPLFRGLPWTAGCCEMHRDVNGDHAINISDLTYLISYIFKGGSAPLGCPE